MKTVIIKSARKEGARECPRVPGGARLPGRGNENSNRKICSEREGWKECPRVPGGAKMPVRGNENSKHKRCSERGGGEGMPEGARWC